MKRFKNPIRTLVYCPMLIAMTASLATSSLIAQEKKDAQPAAPAKKDVAAQRLRPTPEQRALNQDRAAVKPTDELVGPPSQSGPVKGGAMAGKPGVEIPKPTVVLKPGEVPAVRFDTPIYDFGKVRSGPEVAHDYWFTNTGTGPLEILRVKPSCGCTTAGEFDRIVLPGATGKIPVKIATSHAGVVSKSITVNTNIIGQDAIVSLQLKGEVWQAIQATPTSAAFGRITTADADKGAMRKITIVNNTEEPLKLSEPKSSNPKFAATIAPTADGKKFELTVTVVPPLIAGNNNGNIDIETGVKELPKLSVPVYAFVTASIDVTPNGLTVAPSRSAPLTRQFYVRSNVDKAFKITNLACTNPEITMDLADVKEAKTFRLTINVPTAYKPRAGGDQITFNTDDPAVPLITIPVTEVAPVRPMPPVAGAAGPNQNPRLNRLQPANGAPRTAAMNPAKSQGPNPTMNTSAVNPAKPASTGASQEPTEKKSADQGNTVKPTESKDPAKPAAP